jgi:hypothetical protein
MSSSAVVRVMYRDGPAGHESAPGRSGSTVTRISDRRAVGYSLMVLGDCLLQDGSPPDAMEALSRAVGVVDTMRERMSGRLFHHLEAIIDPLEASAERDLRLATIGGRDATEAAPLMNQELEGSPDDSLFGGTAIRRRSLVRRRAGMAT